MDLGLFNVSDTYQYVLNQSGSNPITLGSGQSVNWNAGGVVDLSSTQTIVGSKTFSSIINGNINGNAATATNATNTTNATFATSAGTVTNGVYTTGNNTINGTIRSRNLYLEGDNTHGYVRASGLGSNLYLGANNTNHVTITSDGQVAFNYFNSGTVSNTSSNLRLDKYSILRMTPSASLTALTTTAPPAGAKSTVIISGTAGYTHTFVSPFKVAGTLATVANRSYTISFVSDGTFVYEQCRAMTLL